MCQNLEKCICKERTKNGTDVRLNGTLTLKPIYPCSVAPSRTRIIKKKSGTAFPDRDDSSPAQLPPPSDAPCWPENAAAAGRRQQELHDKERTTSSHNTNTSARAGATRCSGAGRPRQRRRRVYRAPATTSSPLEKQLLRANVAPDRGTIGREQRSGNGVGELHEGRGRSGGRCRGRRPSRARRATPGLRSPGKATPAASGANSPPPTFAHLLGTCRGKNGELLSPALAVFGHVHCCCNGNSKARGASFQARERGLAWWDQQQHRRGMASAAAALFPEVHRVRAP